MDRYRISQLAEIVGVPATTLRFYETQELLPAQRSANGYRLYGDHDVERVRFIAAAKDLGLPLTRIRELLAIWQTGMCRDVRGRLLPLVAEQLTAIDHRIDDLDALRRHLVAAEARLTQLPDRDTPCDPSCAFLTGEPPGRPENAVPPIACSLAPEMYTDRVARWRNALAGTKPQVLDDGTVRTAPPPDRAGQIAQLISDEAACCPFLTFTLTVTGHGMHLDATAPPDARSLLADLFALTTESDRC